ncbi:MAG: hypothetical protein ACPGWM_10930, partial [Flavobacteriales bacterium]
SYGNANFFLVSKTKAILNSNSSIWEFTLGPNFKILACSLSDQNDESVDELWVFNHNSEGQLSNATMHNSKGILMENWRITYDSQGRIIQQFDMLGKTKMNYSYQDLY